MTEALSPSTRPLRVLALDGGGIHGVIPATLLAEIERRCNKPIAEMFELIAGTSTAGRAWQVVAENCKWGVHSAGSLLLRQGLYEGWRTS